MRPDRSLILKPGQIVCTGYVDITRCAMACRERMAVGDVDRAFQRVLQLGDSSMWPCPNGRWDGDRFLIEDGRHEFVASLMLGRTHLLVAWVVDSAGPERGPGPSGDPSHTGRNEREKALADRLEKS